MIRATLRLRVIYGGIGDRHAVDVRLATIPGTLRDRIGLTDGYRDVEVWTEDADHDGNGKAFITRHNVVVTLLATSQGHAIHAMTGAHGDAWNEARRIHEEMESSGNRGTVLVEQSSLDFVDVGTVAPSEFDDVGGAS